jgi:hypothetical protein
MSTESSPDILRLRGLKSLKFRLQEAFTTRNPLILLYTASRRRPADACRHGDAAVPDVKIPGHRF